MRKPQPTTDVLVATERGGMRKKWKGRLPVALVFANTYQVGMSNLGFQILYALPEPVIRISSASVFFSRLQAKSSVRSSHRGP